MRRGLTLVELLIVCFILVLFVAIAAPLLRTNNDNTRVREATRQVNAFFAEAKTLSAQSGRPVGVILDRRAAVAEGGRDSNLITRLSFAESPPMYGGDVDTARVGLWFDPAQQMAIPGFTQAPINGNPPRLITLDFEFTPGESAMLSVIIPSYFANPNQPAPGDLTPFTIQFGGHGRRHPALAYATGTPGLPSGIPNRPIQYLCLSEYGDSLYGQQIPSPPAAQSPRVYQITFAPQASSQSPLELPSGTVIDLQYSGFGGTGTQLFDPSRTSTRNVVCMFDATGAMSHIQLGPMLSFPPGRLHLLIGTDKLAIDSIDAANPANRAIQNTNLSDPLSFWLTVGSRTGMEHTAPNGTVVPGETVVANAVNQARSLARSLNGAGGR